MLSCTPGLIFAGLSGLAVVSSMFGGWKAFISTLLTQAVVMLVVVGLCRGCHTTALWWILAILVGLPLALIAVVFGFLYSVKEKAESK